ncbi:flavin monoamine oxidase family protein [Chryseobacterium carnipullorum]|uniref:flavin monoamine oxidase family protein n=1 Tax=Chryseobacterium carnipullorum TaxID=1124835 RepID=UPI000923AD17|nr:FAD-dependent oxidoreductase [Chryseobacterium carnipullorum]SHM44524.1 Flavin containing amine oxidoreductase [Chryseobacterium carnipullorum]HBV15840.1 NAD(P)/FAD-dependent oxidoreductase [Chryseobacterium carnipullorum]
MNKNTPLNTGKHPDLKIEVAIIGAGTSGLYTAYRLVTDKKYKASEVQIFDMNNKLGGRLESVVMPGMNFWGELGGMRYLTSQEIVTTLIEGYPLTEEDPAKRIPVLKDTMTPVAFPMGDPSKLLMYLRKDRCKQDAWNVAQDEGKKLPTRYYLNDDDDGFSSDQLFNKIIYEVLMADPWVAETYKDKIIKGDGIYDYSFKLTSEDWDVIKPRLVYNFPNSPYDQRKVNDLGFWNLIKDQISQEGYEFVANAGGYYSNTINWNSAEAFPYMVGDFSAGTIYKTIEEGYDSIAYAVANSYMDHEGACIWSENKLLTFTKEHSLTNTHKYQLTFLNLKTNTTWNVYANTLILAMPRKSLELLDQNNFFFNINENSVLNTNIRSVIMEPAFKILMGFEYPWWKELQIDSGHSITDLPMRQCYYFGTDPETNNSMLLGSYGDMETETFWKALTDDKLLFEVRAAKSASLKELHQLDDVQATKLMVDELMNQLRELHGPDVTIPEPYVTYFKDWTDEPFGAGYHAWKAGYSVENVMPYMRKPVANERIHIIGEAYSDQQGWVEGAFCEAEKMLQEHFGMDRPIWLSPTYYMGW